MNRASLGLFDGTKRNLNAKPKCVEHIFWLVVYLHYNEQCWKSSMILTLFISAQAIVIEAKRMSCKKFARRSTEHWTLWHKRCWICIGCMHWAKEKHNWKMQFTRLNFAFSLNWGQKFWKKSKRENVQKTNMEKIEGKMKATKRNLSWFWIEFR